MVTFKEALNPIPCWIWVGGSGERGVGRRGIKGKRKERLPKPMTRNSDYIRHVLSQISLWKIAVCLSLTSPSYYVATNGNLAAAHFPLPLFLSLLPFVTLSSPQTS